MITLQQAKLPWKKNRKWSLYVKKQEMEHFKGLIFVVIALALLLFSGHLSFYVLYMDLQKSFKSNAFTIRTSRIVKTIK